MRRALILVTISLAASVANAEVIELAFDDRAELQAWTASGGSGWTIANGALQSDVFARWTRNSNLEATRGWVVEAWLAIDGTVNGMVGFGGADDRQGVIVYRRPGAVELDGFSKKVVEDGKLHHYRLEVQAGRHRLLIDGVLALERDEPIEALIASAWTPEVSFGASSGIGDKTLAHRWDRLRIDTAPSGLAASQHRIPRRVAAHRGPLLDLMRRLAGLAPAHEQALLTLRLGEEARACVAFHVVMLGTERPARRLQKRELDRLIAAERPQPPPPRDPNGPICTPARECDCGRCPPLAPRVVNGAGELLGALAETDPARQRESFDRAIEAMLESRVPTKGRDPPPLEVSPAGTRRLLAALRDLQARPRACR